MVGLELWMLKLYPFANRNIQIADIFEWISKRLLTDLSRFQNGDLIKPLIIVSNPIFMFTVTI